MGEHQMVPPKSLSVKIIWWLVFVASLSGFIYQSYLFLSDYYAYPSVSYTHIAEKELPTFPDVTFCSYTKFDKDRFQKSVFCVKNPKFKLCEEEKDSFGYSYGQDVVPPVISFKFCGQTLSSVYKEETNGSYTTTTESTSSGDGGESKSNTFSKQEIEQLLRVIDTKMSFKEKVAVGLNKSAFITKCLYMGEICNERDFYHFHSFEFGNCFTFSPPGGSGRLVRSEGPYLGLSVDLNEQHGTGITDIEKVDGYRVTINEEKIAPFPEFQGIDIQKGLKTSIGVRQVEKRWLKKPYVSHCDEKDVSSIFKEKKDQYKYSVKLCQYSCMQAILTEHCGCTDPRLHFKNTIYDGKSCDIYNQTQICCLENISQRIWKKELGNDCHCPLSCKKTDYLTSISSAKVANKDLSYGMSNHAHVQLYFNTIELKIDELKPKYKPVDIFSNIGGQIGLFLGVSFIAIYDFLESSILSCLKRFSKKKGIAVIKSAGTPTAWK